MNGLLDICAGYGGFSLGFEPEGFRTVAFAEIDPFACAILKHRWPDVPNLGDVSRIRGRDIAARVVTAGFPCQGLSVAGKRKGLEDHRSGLFYEITRLVAEMRDAGNGPDWLVLENVEGLLSNNGGRDFTRVLSALAQLGPVELVWRVLDAQFFGVAQRRLRVFIVVDFGGPVGRARQVLFEPEGVRRDSQASGTAGEEVACFTPASIGGYRDGVGTLRANGGDNGGGTETLIACSESGQGWWREGIGSLRAEGENRPSRPSTVVVFDEAQVSNREHRVTYEPGRPSPPLTHQNTGRMSVAHTLRADSFDASEDGTGRGTPLVAASLVSDGNQHSCFRHEAGLVPECAGVRRLLPIECERLRGLADEWTLVPYRGKPAADGPRYRAIGNGVAVPCIRWIARRIRMVEQDVLRGAA